MVNADVTLIAALPPLESVAFIVGLVVPTTTLPKTTGVKTTTGGIGVPWMGTLCGLPEALSVTLSVALLTALPGLAGFAKYVIPKLQVPPFGVRVTLPDPT